MTREYRNDEASLEAYVAATFDTSESVNLYSVLLRKHGVHAERQAAFGWVPHCGGHRITFDSQLP